MFENESAAVRLGIEFLTALVENDYREDPTFNREDLESKLEEIEGDVNSLIGNLPYEAIDDDEELEEQYPEEFSDNEELEDEVVECDRLIAQAQELLATVRDMYLSDEESEQEVEVSPSSESVSQPLEPEVSEPVKQVTIQTPKPEVKKRRRHRIDDDAWVGIILAIGLIVIPLIMSLFGLT